MLVGAAIGAHLIIPAGNSGWAWIALPLIAVVVLWLLVGILIRRLVAPMGRVLDASDRVAAGDYSTRLPEHGLHEFHDLARSFNSMSSRLEAYDGQRKRLLADISHELRTPLTVLQGNVEGMLDNVYPRDDEHLMIALNETHILARLVDDLRTLSLTETGLLSLRKEKIYPARWVVDLVGAMQPQADRYFLHLSAEPEPDMPPIELDPARIRQVVENIIANAMRHTPAGGDVRVGCRRVHSSPDQAEFWVVDTGHGIPPESLPKIFDRYYKSSDSGGTGLGLAIAKQLVEAHGGSIFAESTPGKGTQIRFYLPYDAHDSDHKSPVNR
jgi:signal transduction histidine kinase